MLNLSISICFIILLFLVPGALARKAYNSVKISDYHSKASSLSEIVLTIALSVLIQFAGLLVLMLYDYFCYCPYRVDYHAILSLLSFNTNSASEDIFQPIENNLMLIMLYQVTLYLLCVVISRGFLGIVINYKLDRKIPFLRFDTEWHYILTGRVINSDKTVIKYANVLVDMDDDSYIIYSGVLTDYNVNKDGELKLIELKGVKKKVISKENPSDPQEHVFKVHSFFIPYENIKNFSITYFNLDAVDASNTSRWKRIGTLVLRYAFHALLIIICVAFLYFIYKLIMLSNVLN